LLHRAGPQLPGALDDAEDLARGIADLGAGDLGIDHPELVHAVDQVVDVRAGGGEGDAQELVPGGSCQAQRHPPVEEHDASLGIDDDVARVRIGVHEAVDEEHPEVDLDQDLHDAAELELARGEALDEAVDLVAVDPLQDEDAAPRELLVDAGRAHAPVLGEDLAECRDVLGLAPEVDLLPDPNAELPDDGGERPDVVVGEEDVQEEEDPERDVEVDGDEGLDAGSQDLDGDILAGHPCAVHLAEARGGDRLAVEGLEDLIHRPPQLGGDDGLDLRRRDGRDTVLEPADRREVRFGEDVGAGAEDLRQLDERRPQVGNRGGKAVGPTAVVGAGTPRGAAEQDPAPAVSKEREEEGRQAPEDYEGATPPGHRSSSDARPRRKKNPARSVNVVTKIEEAMAGSTPSRSRRIGTNAPARDATIRFPHMAKSTTRPSFGVAGQ